MQNLYSLERAVLDRQGEIMREVAGESILRRLAGETRERAGRDRPSTSLAERAGLLLVQAGLRIAEGRGSQLEQRGACVCVPVE